MSHVRKKSDRVLAVLLSLLMLLSIMPISSAYAMTNKQSELSTNLDSIEFAVNDAVEFTVTSTANDDADKMVKGYFEFSNPSAIEKLEYYETTEGMEGWYELKGEFGPSTGFPLRDATSKFRVTFNTAGSYSVNIYLKDAVTDKIYCQTTAKTIVKEKSSTITTDLASKNIVVNQALEFSVTTHANEDAGKIVKGSFIFSEPSAIEKLEYYETTEGMEGWYELKGDFGPETGFPFTNATSRFRATFNKAGNYTVSVFIKELSGNKELCRTNVDITVNKADITGVSISPTTNKYNGSQFALATLNGEIKDGDIVTYTVKGDANIYSSVPCASDIGDYVVTISIDRGSNYNIYTQTVTSTIELGDLELGGIKIKGLESKYNGKPQEVVTVTGKGNYDLKYKLGNSEWSDTIPTVTDAGSYIVIVKATKHNYKDENVDVEAAESAEYPYNVFVAQAEQEGFAFEIKTPDSLEYNRTATYIAKGGQSSGNITYEIVDGNEYVSLNALTGEVKAIKAGGTATIKATKAGDKNYKEISDSYTISTKKAEQTDFNFEKENYTVSYGTRELLIKAKGGQSGEDITYEVIEGNAATVETTEKNECKINFANGKNGKITIKATLIGGENYNDISATTEVEVSAKDLSAFYSVEGNKNENEWYNSEVKIVPKEGYKIAESNQFDADWADEIIIQTDGINSKTFYLKEIDTGYISEAITKSDIKIDESNPINLKISYSSSVIDVILNNITYGFYKSDVTVTFEATDEISGIDYLKYKIGNSNEKEIDENNWKFDNNGKTVTADVKISPNISGKIEFTATDKSGNSSTLSGEKTLVADDISPKVSVEFDNNDVRNEKYFNDKRTATISIDEENFFKDDIYKIIEENNEDGIPVKKDEKYLTISVGKLNDKGEYVTEHITPTFEENNGVYEAKVEFKEAANYEFDVKFYDYSLNEANVSYDGAAPKNFIIDTDTPRLSISYNDTEAVESERNTGYYKGKRTAKIEVTECNFDASDLKVDITAENIGEKDSDTIIGELESKLKEQKNWENNGNVHTAYIDFTEDAKYKIKLNYTDKTGHKADEITSDFCLDNTSPKELGITYSSSVLDTILNGVSFGFYNGDVEVSLLAEDRTSGIDFFEYSYEVDYSNDKEGHEYDVGHKDDKGGSGVVNAKEENGKIKSSFTIPSQFRGYVSFVAVDKSENSEEFTDSKRIVVDSVAPGVNVTYDNNNAKNEKYYNDNRTATISISPDNFFKDYLYGDKDENYLELKVQKKLQNDETFTEIMEQPAFVRDEIDGNYKAEVHFEEEAEYIFSVKYKDKSGNVFSYKEEFIIDKKSPEVTVEFKEPPYSKNGNQYNDNRTAEIIIKEYNFDAKDVDVIVEAKDNQGNIPNYANELKDNSKWKKVGNDIYKADILFDTDAHYIFDIKCADLAGNVYDSYEADLFTIDKTAPTEMDIKIDNQSVIGSMDTLTFDRFYNSSVAVKLSANCDISGFESFKYQKVSDVSEYDDINGQWLDYKDCDKTGIIVSPNEKFVIYFKAEDRAGNFNIVRSTGIIVDDQKPVGEINAPEIDILPEKPDSNGIHNNDVNVNLKVVEPKYTGSQENINGYYSGLNKITYKIFTTDTKDVENGTLFEAGKLKPGEDGAKYNNDNLAYLWNGSLTIDSAKFNSNNVIVEVTATDNAGNTRISTTSRGDIKIDTTAPKIDVSYDNNNVDSGKYFKSSRTATISITERNFNADDVKVNITNTDGVVPEISNWKKKSGNGNNDNTVWTTTVKYSADGDYMFDISYTDLAGNRYSGVDYGNSEAPKSFTIDKTVPVIKVTYNNNNSLNGNYYNNERVATIEIKEHNFNISRIKTMITATDDGKSVSLPKVNGWTSNGDIHTATITYKNDALYSFDIEYSDLAGNSAADFAKQSFYIDKTAPALEISGVSNQSANKGDVIPVVAYSDTNIDISKVKITLTGANRKSVELDGSYSDIHNGQIFTFNNFAKEKEIDDIYMLTAALTDKAGNTTTETINFSVNRFGSTYSLSDFASKLNGTYIKEPVDVIITETNADKLSDIKITLFKNGESIVLTEGEDYKIDISGGNGRWYHYTYTVYAKNFADDAVYSLTVESNDAAGNKAKNDLDTKNTAITFGVDSTMPIINIENLESKTTYAMDSITVNMSVEDNLKLVKVFAELDGKEIKSWSGEALEEIIKNGGNFSFDIDGTSTSAHNLIVYAVDAAGNGEKISETDIPANAEKVENFYVTTNLWVRYYTNKPLFFGSISGVVLLSGLIVFLVVYKKKKNEEK